ncbi:MAG: TRAP transporter small permease [Deltaproteobacteria bacterium]|nr:TRAP transporter small permease [Deltaproteobacteria bacterium]
MLILVAFFGCAWALPAGGHVAVDIFTEHMETRRKAKLEIITSLMAMTYMLVFFYEASIFAWDAWEGGVRSTEYLAWPLWPMRSFLVIGSFFLVFEFLFRVVRSITILKGPAQTESQGGR